jgi:hypothetical protein
MTIARRNLMDLFVEKGDASLFVKRTRDGRLVNREGVGLQQVKFLPACSHRATSRLGPIWEAVDRVRPELGSRGGDRIRK